MEGHRPKGGAQYLKSYECTIIISSSTGEADVKDYAKKYANVIESGGGELTQLENWGRRKLAYEINHIEEGYYLFYKMRCENRVLEELNRLLRLDESVLRHLIIRDSIATGDESKIDPNEVLPGGSIEKEEI